MPCFRNSQNAVFTYLHLSFLLFTSSFYHIPHFQFSFTSSLSSSYPFFVIFGPSTSLHFLDSKFFLLHSFIFFRFSMMVFSFSFLAYWFINLPFYLSISIDLLIFICLFINIFLLLHYYLLFPSYATPCFANLSFSLVFLHSLITISPLFLFELSSSVPSCFHSV